LLRVCELRISQPFRKTGFRRILVKVDSVGGFANEMLRVAILESVSMKYLTSLVLILAVQPSLNAAETNERPNVLWFVVDDMSANFSCYGEKLIETPNVDRLAREGTRFANAFVTAPVCSPCRSAMITGMYQTSIGAHHHRSGRGELKIHLPDGVVPAPKLFRQAGYYTCIGSGLSETSGAAGKKGKLNASAFGKTDYNFEWDASIYDSADWAGRQPGQPFFMQVQLPGGKLRGGTDESAQKLLARAKQEFGESTDPESVTLPPYYPRDPVLLRDWAAYLDSVRFTDRHVGDVVARLEKEGILDNTLIIFMTDHGISHARGKQFLYNEGTHVPFIVRGPGNARGEVRSDLIEHIDMAAISLATAGIKIPTPMQGRNVFAKDYEPRTAVFAARDRCDETVERLRSVRTDRFLYIRNFYPKRPHLQPNAYKDGKSIVQTLRYLHDPDQLSPLMESLLFSPTRPAEELYEWTTDTWQVKNLAGEAAHQEALQQLRAQLSQWMINTNDHGAESDAMYDSDMAVYVGKGNPEVEKNIAIMKQWATEEQGRR
jgi:arylsulfatase A-like enzyme